MEQTDATSTLAPALTPPTEAIAIVQMIERAARDPAIDIARMQSLIEMREAMRRREAEVAFDEAMTAAQSEMRAVAVDSNNPQTHSRYASYYAIDQALRPIYTRHGLSLSFNTAPSGSSDSVKVVCRVGKGGYGRDYQIDMPADGKGARGGDVMTKTHATGSAVSYGMRYLLKMIFNVAIAEEDDDGTRAGRVERKPPTPAPNVINPAAARDAADKPPLAHATSLKDMAREAAMRGPDVFDAFYKSRSPADKAVLRMMKPELEGLMPPRRG